MGWSNLREQVGRLARVMKENAEVELQRDEADVKQLGASLTPHALYEQGQQAVARVAHAAHEAPGAIARAGTQALHAAEAAPSAIYRAGERAVHHVLSQPAHATQPHPHPRAHATGAPAARRPVGNQTYAPVDGSLYMKGPNDASGASPLDVHQGQAGDCWFISAMAAIARANPAQIGRLIKPLGNNRYEVTLYIGPADKDGHPAPEKIVVDNTFPEQNGRPMYVTSREQNASGHELWPMLLEKAIAVAWNGYQGSVYKKGIEGRLFSGIDILQPQGAEGVHRFPTMGHSEDFLLDHMADALATHRPVTANSKADIGGGMLGGYLDKYGVADGHVYSIESVDRTRRTVTLQNPWGHKDVVNMPISDFVMCYVLVEIGPQL